jgi:regulatory protein
VGRTPDEAGGDRESAEVSLGDLESKALSYLERFDSSAANLRRVLQRHAVRRLGGQAGEVLPTRTARVIDELVLRYEHSGIVSDIRYATSIARTLRDRGMAKKSIVARLQARGVNRQQAELALANVDADTMADAELVAAKKLVRRRRLGPHRSMDERAAWRQRDLGILARAGFSLQAAQAALGAQRDEEDP